MAFIPYSVDRNSIASSFKICTARFLKEVPTERFIRKIHSPKLQIKSDWTYCFSFLTTKQITSMSRNLQFLVQLICLNICFMESVTNQAKSIIKPISFYINARNSLYPEQYHVSLPDVMYQQEKMLVFWLIRYSQDFMRAAGATVDAIHAARAASSLPASKYRQRLYLSTPLLVRP